MSDLQYLLHQTVDAVTRADMPETERRGLYTKLFLFHQEYEGNDDLHLWHLLRNEGRMDYQETSPEDYPLLQMIREVLEIAQKENNTALSVLWYQAILKYIFWNAEEEDREDIEKLIPFLQQEHVYEGLQADAVFMDGLTAVQTEWDDLPLFSKEWLSDFQRWDMQSYTDPDAITGKLIRFFTDRRYNEAFRLARQAQAYYPGHALILLYESISAVMHLQGKGISDKEAYAEWIGRLENLQDLNLGSEENTRTVQTHARYYLAVACVMTGEQEKAQSILQDLITTYQMPEAHELLAFVSQSL